MTVRLLLSSCIIIAFAVMSSGCATITSSESQPLTVTAQDESGEPVEQAKCVLKNDKGEWQTQTPGFASVRRSSVDLMVECSKDGRSPGLLRAVSRAAGGMFGN
ncbi:MAG: hypothetical protein IT508_06520, partial [Burkholderiaceae bacterium]|nr:hypothetical protein [Burkholderiaceae bacterium]